MKFAKMPLKILYDKKLSDLSKLVFATLNDMANQEGECWPKQEKIAELLGKHRKNINIAIKALESKGYIQIEKKGKNRNVLYKILMSNENVTELLVTKTLQQDVCCNENVTPCCNENVTTIYNEEPDPIEPDLKRNLSFSLFDESELATSSPVVATEPPCKAEKAKNPRETALLEAFEEFWKKYPKQRIGNKNKALSAFKRAIAEKRVTAEQLLVAVVGYAASKEVKEGWAKGCQAWLNDDRWTPFIPVEATKTLEEQQADRQRKLNGYALQAAYGNTTLIPDDCLAEAKALAKTPEIQQIVAQARAQQNQLELA